MFVLFIFWWKARRWPQMGDPMALSWTDQNINIRRLGFILQGWLLLTRMSSPSKPDGFERVIASLQEMQSEDDGKETRTVDPDIVFLMMESFADLKMLGLPLAVEPLAYMKAERTGRASGKLNVSVIGGNTCNTEFEILTGIPLGLDSTHTIPYMSCISDAVYALPRCLERRGYISIAVHPFHRWFYNRDRVYHKLGFTEFFADESFVGAVRNLAACLTRRSSI